METSNTSPSLLDRKSGHSSKFQSRDRLIESIVNKLVKPVSSTLGATSGRIPSQTEVSPIVRDTIQSVNDSENVLRVLPDLNLAAEIQIASILSSKDLITTALIFDATACEDLELNLRAELIDKIRKHIEDEFKLNDRLYDILYDVLYRTGSYAVSIIPESSVDRIINGVAGTKVSLESLHHNVSNALKPQGILGPIVTDHNKQVSFGLEALTSAPNNNVTDADLTIKWAAEDIFGPIRISDNPDITKVKMAQGAIARAKLMSTYRVATESEEDYVSSLRADPRMYKNPLYSAAVIHEITPAEQVGRASIGRPLVQHYPSESVIPIHASGDFKLQIGYLVVLDNLGNPVSKHDMVNSNIGWNWINSTASSNVMQGAAKGLGLSRDQNTMTNMTVSQLTNSFAEFVEGKVINAIQNGVYGDSVTMSRPQDVYRIMMARALAKKGTQLLYIPCEQMVYFALDYNEFGIGESLLSKNKMLSTVRTALQFAQLNGAVLNSTRNVEYNIQLDPGDREAEKTISDVSHRVMQSYNNDIPFTGTPDDMWAYMTNAGISFSIEGNEYYPSTKVTMSDNSPDYKTPDAQVEEDFARRHYRGLGLDPELIISPDQIEFASQVTSKNLLSARRICKIQERIDPFITQFVKTYILSDGVLMRDLGVIVKEHLGDVTQKGVIGKHINTLLRTLTVTLPSPDTSMLTSQMEQFDQRIEAIDKLLEVYINDDTFAASGVDVDTMQMRGAVKAYIMRQWCRENDVEPDLQNLFNDTDRRAELVQSIGQESVDTATLVAMVADRISSRGATVAKRFELEGGGDAGADYGSDDSFGDDSGGDEFGGGEDDGFGDDTGGDDFGGDDFGDDTGEDAGSEDDLGGDDDFGDEEPAEEEPTEEEPVEEEPKEEKF